MDKKYYLEIFKSSATLKEKEKLLAFFRNTENNHILDTVEKNALMIEFPSWKVAFYSHEDIELAIETLEENIHACV